MDGELFGQCSLSKLGHWGGLVHGFYGGALHHLGNEAGLVAFRLSVESTALASQVETILWVMNVLMVASTAAQSAAAAPVLAEEVLLDGLLDDVWSVVVVNDDVNTFAHVIRAFCEVLDYTPDAAERKAMEIHTRGRAEVWVAGREECVFKAQILRDAYKLDARALPTSSDGE